MSSKPSGTPADRPTWFIRLTDAVGRTIVRCLARTDISGLEHARGLEGPLIVAANHASNADGVMVACWITPALGRRIYLLGKREALDWPLLGWGLAQNAVIGIRRGAADLEAFRAARAILDEGHVLAIFPEGTRSADGTLGEAKDGLAILALRTGARILPVGLGGTHRFWPRGRGLQFGRRVRMRVGEPFLLEAIPAGTDRREAQRRATREIMNRIAALLPPDQRGAWTDTGRDGPGGPPDPA